MDVRVVEVLDVDVVIILVCVPRASAFAEAMRVAVADATSSPTRTSVLGATPIFSSDCFMPPREVSLPTSILHAPQPRKCVMKAVSEILMSDDKSFCSNAS